MIEPDADPAKAMEFSQWKSKAFEGCVMDMSDAECNLKDGTRRDFAIVSTDSCYHMYPKHDDPDKG